MKTKDILIVAGIAAAVWLVKQQMDAAARAERRAAEATAAAARTRGRLESEQSKDFIDHLLDEAGDTARDAVGSLWSMATDAFSDD